MRAGWGDRPRSADIRVGPDEGLQRPLGRLPYVELEMVDPKGRQALW